MLNICYFCGKAATTREHLPPRQMFKGFSCDSITVPSCKEHNCSKSGEDQAIVNALLIPFRNQVKLKTNNNIFNKDILKAILIADSSFERTKYRVISKHFISDLPEEIKNLAEVSFLKPPIKIHNWIKKLTAGLVFYCTQKYDPQLNWEIVQCWSPDWLKYVADLKIDEAHSILQLKANLRQWLNEKKWINGWSATPKPYPSNIYYFQICFDDDEIAFKHIFYNNYIWYVWLKNKAEIKNSILSKLNLL
jgi:hypothetical protein